MGKKQGFLLAWFFLTCVHFACSSKTPPNAPVPPGFPPANSSTPTSTESLTLSPTNTATSTPTQTIPSTPSWKYVGSPGFSSGPGSYTSIYIDGGTLYVSYTEGTNGGRVTVMKFDGVNWVPVGNPSLSPGDALNTSLSFYNGKPCVAFVDYVHGGGTAMSFNGSSWEYVGTPGALLSINLTLFVSNNVPYAVGGFDSNSFICYYFDGTDWAQMFPWAEAGRSPSLYVDNGTAYVACLDGTNYLPGSPGVKTFDGSNWVDVGLFPASSQLGAFPAIFVSNNTPYLAFRELLATGPIVTKATVMKFNGSQWVGLGNPDFTPQLSSDPNAYKMLFVDGDTPYVVFGDAENGEKASVMKYEGGSWSYVGEPDFSAGSAYTPMLSVSNGVPYVVYTDGGNGGKVSVMAYY